MSISDYATLRRRLDQLGHSRLPGLFEANDLCEAQAETAELIARWQAGGRSPDFWSAPGDSGRPDILYRIHRLEQNSPAVCTLLASRKLLAAVESIVGPGARATACALTIKMPEHGLPVPWHRDPIKVRPGCVFNFSIYLDRSSTDNGCLGVVPKSHRLPDCDLPAAEPPPGWVPLEAETGDVLVHDVRILHGSLGCRGNRLRRAIVVEFQPSGLVVGDRGPASPS